MATIPAPTRWAPQIEGERYDPEATAPEFRFEVLDGIIVRKTVGAAEVRLAKFFYDLFSPAVRAAGLGDLYPELGYELSDDGPKRKPDLSFLSFQQWPANRPFPPGEFIPAVPELAIEVISPHETMRSARRKVGEYFRGGSQLVWLVLPDDAEIHVYTSPTEVRILTRSDTLTGDPVIPGFRMPLADLFPPAEPASATP